MRARPPQSVGSSLISTQAQQNSPPQTWKLTTQITCTNGRKPPASLSIMEMPSVSVAVKMDAVTVTVPELPEVNVAAGGGEFELFFEANVDPEKQMAYIVRLFLLCCTWMWPNDRYINT